MNLYTVRFGIGSTEGNCDLDEFLRASGIEYRTYFVSYIPDTFDMMIEYSIEATEEFMSVLVLKYPNTVIVSTLKGFDKYL